MSDDTDKDYWYYKNEEADDRRAAALEREIEANLADLGLDGTYDHYLGQFLSVSDEDYAKLEGYYYAGDLCPSLREAYEKVEAQAK